MLLRAEAAEAEAEAEAEAAVVAVAAVSALLETIVRRSCSDPCIHLTCITTSTSIVELHRIISVVREKSMTERLRRRDMSNFSLTGSVVF